MYSNETVGQVGIAAESFITPLIKTIRAEDRKKQATQEAVVLGLKIANMGAVAYGANKYYQAESKAVRGLKEMETKGKQQITAKQFPKKEIKKDLTNALESGNIQRAKAKFDELTTGQSIEEKRGEWIDMYDAIDAQQPPVQKHTDEIASVIYGQEPDVEIEHEGTITTVKNLYDVAELAVMKRQMDNFSKKQAEKANTMLQIKPEMKYSPTFIPYNQRWKKFSDQ